VSMLLFSAAPSLTASFPIALLVGFSSVAFMTGSSAVVQLRSAPTMRGRVLALQAIVFIGSTPVGGPLLGALCDRYGARAGLVVGGVAALAAGAWGYRKTRRMAGAGGTSVDGIEALEAEAAEMQVA
jgi:MFS family permease